MKKILIYTILCMLCPIVFAQQKPDVKITDVKITKVDQSVTLSFEVLVNDLGSNDKIVMTPHIYNRQGNKAVTPMYVMGRKKYYVDRRNANIPKNYVPEFKHKRIKYFETTAFEPWMDEVSLNVELYVEGCCKQIQFPSKLLTENKLIHYKPVPVFNSSEADMPLSDLQQFDKVTSFLYPATDFDKRYEIFKQQREKGALMIYFEQGKSKIDPLYKNNQTTLNQVNKVLDLIEADPNASLKKIVIIGMTSPEGMLASNNTLAAKRAEALKVFLGERLKFNSELFEIINGSEDWNGLRRQVNESQMPERWQVLEIIDRYSVTGGREKKLMDLRKGIPYRYMSEHFFPQLRNAGYIQIYYDSKTDPETERIRKATVMVKKQQYEAALALLLNVGTDKKVDNLIGICYMMQGDYIKAEGYFEKAIKYGDENARINLTNVRKALSITNQ